MGKKSLNPIKSRISEAIKEHGMKARLAEMLGFKRGSISDMLKSPGDPPLHYVKATSELTGYSEAWLLNEEGPKKLDASASAEYEQNELDRIRAENRRLRAVLEKVKREVENLQAALREIENQEIKTITENGE